MNEHELIARLGELGISVERSRAVTTLVSGRPGQYYLMRRLLRDQELARLTHRSGDIEVNVTRINDHYLVYFANRTGGTVGFPRTGGGITRVEWLVHTHPLENRSRGNRVPDGPSPTDSAALEMLHSRDPYHEISSRILIVRGGRVVRVRTFRLPPEEEEFHVMP